MRNVCSAEASKGALRSNFTAIRIWIDWPDEERATCFDSTAKQRRRLPYEIAAEDPVAITRIFYYTVRTVLVELGLILNELFHSSETLTLRAIFSVLNAHPGTMTCRLNKIIKGQSCFQCVLLSFLFSTLRR